LSFSFSPDYWAVILGGSSGFGLATARKLSAHGMNICIVHRDRRGAMKKIEPEFDKIRSNNVKLITCNANALSDDARTNILDQLKDEMGPAGKVRIMLHSIAYGNLKLMAPQKTAKTPARDEIVSKLAERINVSKSELKKNIDALFAEGNDALVNIAEPANYNNEELLTDEDFALTIYSMGSSIAAWVKGLFDAGLFADDSRVIGLTSEGNEVAWRGYGAVAAAKVCLESISRAIAREYAPYGIRANIVQAGVTDTPALRMIPGNLQMKATTRMRNPFGRLTRPEDIANFIFLMCLDEAGWVNGDIIRVDGGERISG